MADAGEHDEERPGSLSGIERAIHQCRRCPIGVLGKSVTISRTRGHPHPLEGGGEAWVTAHPSYLLRLKDEKKREQERLFRADLAAVAERLAELAE